MDRVKVTYLNCEAVRTVLARTRSKGTARLVLMLLAMHTSQNATAWPSVKRLADLAGVDERTVQRALSQLEKLGEVEILRQRGKQGTNLYRVNLLLAPSDNLPGEPARGDKLPEEGEGGNLSGRGDKLSDRGDKMSPELNKELKTELIHSSSKQKEPQVPTKATRTHPPTHEEMEKKKRTNKAKKVRFALGELASGVDRLFDPSTPPDRVELWLETALYPELERLGEETFRRAVARLLPQAAGARIKYPTRFLVSKLRQEKAPLSARLQAKILRIPPESEPPDAESGREVRGKGPYARYLAPTCRYGDHPVGDACCLPRALETAAWVVPALGREPEPEEEQRLLETLGTVRDLLEREKDQIPDALERLERDVQDEALRALRELGVRQKSSRVARKGSGSSGSR